MPRSEDNFFLVRDVDKLNLIKLFYDFDLRKSTYFGFLELIWSKGHPKISMR